MKAANSRPGKLFALLVRILLGAFFVVSAIAKMVSIDTFEIYIFSYNILPLNWSLLTARLVIVAELLIGIGLMANIWHRLVNICTISMLTAFSLFLCYAALIGRSDSCQCMGALVHLNPLQSLLKNAAATILLLVAMRATPWNLRPRWYLWLPVILAVCVVPFILSAPDNWLFGPSDEVYNTAQLENEMAPEGILQPLGLDQGRHVVAFLSPGCNFCRMTDEKLTHICHRNGLDSSAFTYLVPTADSTLTRPALDSSFFLRPCYLIPNLTFALITYGQRPLVMLMENGKVQATCHYRNIDEKQICTFLSHEEN